MKFRSAVDTWLFLLILVFPGAIFIFVVVGIGIMNAATVAVIGGLVVLVFGLPIWLLFSTYYLVEASTLKIRSGPFRWSIPLGEIKSVKPSRSAWSSPALSLNRLEIEYGSGKKILVSPKDINGFQSAIGKDRKPPQD